MTTRYTFEVTIHFTDGSKNLPYRCTRWWKTANGALRAGERHSCGLAKYYDNVDMFRVRVLDSLGQEQTTMAA